MSFASLPLEIIVEILKKISLDDLINLSYTDKESREIVKNVRLSHMIKLRRYVDEQLKNIIKNYNFINFDLGYSDITDEGFKVLNNHYCRYVSIKGSNLITNKGISFLKGCHTVNLSYCKLVTDEGIKALSNCYTVNLSWCKLVTDEGIKALSNCHTVDLSECRLVTNEGIKA